MLLYAVAALLGDLEAMPMYAIFTDVIKAKLIKIE